MKPKPLAVGIDVGFSETRRSTAVVILGKDHFVDTAENALARLQQHLEGRRARICIDGPFRPGPRGIERFFCSGPFASGKGLRLCVMQTRPDSPFLTATQRFTAALRAHDLHEIFPTAWLASLQPPRPYTGLRGAHTDDLWRSLRGHPLLPKSLYEAIEAEKKRDLHDLRAAATAAIAASRADSTWLCESGDPGFIFPPKTAMHPEFVALLEAHAKAKGLKLSARPTAASRAAP